MSAQFGRWDFAGQPPDLHHFEKVDRFLAPYGPDASSAYRLNGISILFRAFHTTNESRQETQPNIAKSGVVIAWDGRLDNRQELERQLDHSSSDVTDVAIVASAYERWDVNCLQKLVGDWAISIWNPTERSLILAKDHVGTRHLYYSSEKDRFTWSTVLDPLVLFAGCPFDLEKDYIAGWLSSFPPANLTPYAGILSVPPACYVLVRPGKVAVTPYWGFDPGKRIEYRTEREYEEHFRFAFREAVLRRLRSDTPVLAELSGGLDSSSIVCVADAITEDSREKYPRIDTVSFYDDSEPNWNERPYFTRIEAKRGRSGLHIDVAAAAPLSFEADPQHFAATPQSGRGRNAAIDQCIAGMIRQGNRVVLSGVGGDEVTGGVPNPIPELADLLAQGKLLILARRLGAWAFNKRTPWYQLLMETLREFVAPVTAFPSSRASATPWLNCDVADPDCAHGAADNWKSLGRPSFRLNVHALEILRRQLSCTALSPASLAEYRYPYLDRDLLEFLYAIPREQLVRPGQRRSLMRRAMAGIVPEEILNRSRKAFVARAPMNAITSNLPAILPLTENMQCELFGIVDAKAFVETLRRAQRGEEVAITSILRTLATEVWLRSPSTSFLRRPRRPIADASSLIDTSDSDQTTAVFRPQPLLQLKQNPLERR
jgi:asparagine synthase (glutamine-hydrolysing)